jgi:hypothetical protein
MRTILAIAAKRNMHMHMAGIEITFLKAAFMRRSTYNNPKGQRTGYLG